MRTTIRNLLFQEDDFVNTFLLDIYPAKVAYSLRQLRSNVTSVIRVRRSEDNTVQDFTATQITNGTLLAFTGSGDGFVSTWYDQSGNGIHVSQLNAGNQPQIVSSGNVITDGGKPALFWGSSKTLSQLSTNISHQSAFYVASWDSSVYSEYQGLVTYNYSQNQDLVSLIVGNSYWSYWWNNNPHGANGGSLLTATSPTFVGRNLIFNSTATAPNRSQIFIGTDRNSMVRGWNGKIQEVIIYGNNQTPNRSLIESNINGYYGIY